MVTSAGGAANELGRRLDLEDDLGLIGGSPVMVELRRTIQKVALSRHTDAVLITGPTGSGKELVAQAVHASGRFAQERIYTINCSALPEHLFEAELFGHTRSAFTNAEERKGALKTVRRGTLFLDEIAEMPLRLQAKLLRALENRSFQHLGSDDEVRFEGRVVTATHRDLKRLVARKRFREDLWYRLNQITLRVPPLEERLEDIPALLEHFLRADQRNIHFSPEAVELLRHQQWRGNVRQLRNLLAQLALESGVITPDAVRRVMESAPGRRRSLAAGGSPPPRDPGANSLSRAAQQVLDLPLPVEGEHLPNRLELTENALFAEALARTGGNHARAAELLGVHRKVVNRWVEKHGAASRPE